MAHVVKGFGGLPSCMLVRLSTYEMNTPTFAFPAEADSHLPIPDGRKAKLAVLVVPGKSTKYRPYVFLKFNHR